ncbi:BQ2448_337 [Microbotryum intermedium]|uniref:BQ2448_337 protein n=1 Tax=Microbotryum intermedium TaxID=269621 RepID=A0A238FAV9_9BASI|nr:BQ2448_337 [Microbotryum intermedium]
MLAIHGRDSDGTRRRPMVSRSRLCTPLDHGGFGLIDLPMRLAIDHAKLVFQLRDPDGGEPAAPLTLRKPPPSQHRRPWIWIWWAYFCHPPPKWYHAVRETGRLLPPRWARYFEAWASNLERWANHVLFFPAGHGIQLSVNPTLFRGPDGELMTPTSFIDASKRRHAFVFPPIIPEGHQKIFSLTEQRWKSWWKALRKIRRVHSDAEDTAHLLSLGSFHPGVQLSLSPPHLAIGCPIACRLWAAVTPSLHPVFGDFVYALASRSERRIVELRILFFHSIWKLSRRRRFSSQPLEPITETEFEKLGGSIQGCMGRLASL